jgi:serine/threonine protein kinase/Tfp pilus assembly protein PilF
MTLASGSRLGPYEVVTRLGAGGMGEVYRARDTRLDRHVALKVLPERLASDPLALARFQREARAVAALSHANIVTLHDAGSDQGTHFVVMELLEGQTLGSRLKGPPLGAAGVLEVGAAIADGLAAAHTRGVVHRDIKPENIFLTAQGGVKILDFGLARLAAAVAPLAASADTVSFDTQPGVIVGTVSYMAPEQVRGQTADPRSDVFALGCVLYEALHGRHPFLRDTGADTMAAILCDAPPTLAPAGRLAAALDRIIVRCLDKDAAHRFPSGAELSAALRSLKVAPARDPSDPSSECDTVVQPPSGAQARQRLAASVAVLPFSNLSPDPENEYFSDGLADELIGALSRIAGLHVASRSSAFAFKGRNEDVRRVGERLNVRTVLEGSVRKAGSRLRVSAQLVSTADGYQLWSEVYDRQVEDVFAIQDEIAQSIAAALRVILTEREKRALGQAPAADVQAYEFYLRGRQFFRKFSRRGYEVARQMFARAIEIDPGFARAYAGLADCLAYVYEQGDPDAETLRQADEASRKAQELSPDLAEAHVSRGSIAALRKNYDEAHQAFAEARRLEPGLFEAWSFDARAYFAEGKLAEAAPLLERAVRLRPDAYETPNLLACVYAGLGRHADGQTYYRLALQAAQNHLELHPEDARAHYLGAVAWCRLGEPGRGVEWARRALAIEPDDHNTLYNAACVYALTGRADEALACLEGALRRGTGHRGWVVNDPDLVTLHDDPRFRALLERL